jgi:cysteine desulfurase
MTPIYLDYNATTPIHPAVFAAMRPYLEEHFGNPSSGHTFGLKAKSALDIARTQVARLLGAQASEIIFTGSGTEANNLALMGAATALAPATAHLITSVVEHPAVEQVVQALAQRGWRITRLPVTSTGQVPPESVAKALRKETRLVSIMHANNEVGTINDLAAIAAILRPHPALFHTDAAQSVGKIPTLVNQLKVDLLTVAGHKLYAPKGVGALYVREGTQLAPVTFGASQERGLRPGTENVPHVVALGAACALAQEELEARMTATANLRDQLEQRLVEELGKDNVRVNGHPRHRLPNTLSISLRGVPASSLLEALENRVAASAGAACHASQEDSSVLGHMGVPAPFRNGTLRLSTGRLLDQQAITQAATWIIREALRLRQSSSNV